MVTLKELPPEILNAIAEDATLIDPSQEGMPPPMQVEKQPTLEELYPQFFNYDEATKAITKLLADWGADITDAETRRNERYFNVDVNTLRQNGRILADETFIANRVIDNNIVRERADAMAYLNNGFRLGIFNCISKPEINTLQLDLEVTRGLTYPGWYQEFERYVDGAMLHKYDAMEVVYDSTKPMKVGFEHIGYDNIYFDRGVDDLNKSARVLRRLRANISTLRKYKNKGFNSLLIDDLVTKHEQQDPTREFEIYKVFFVLEGCCYIAWWTNESTVKEWLKAPEKLFLGISDPMSGQPIEIDQYPVFLYVFREDEQQKLVDKKGRAFLDGPEQEATTAIKTGFVNGLVRASNVYGSPSEDSNDSADIKQLDVKLKHGCLYNKPINFFHTDYPDITTLGALQYFSTENAVQLGKTAFAVTNRKDSRKTAEEQKNAVADEQKNVGTKLASFSETLRKILVFSWKIIQSQALENKIQLLLVKTEIPLVQGAPELGTQPAYQNDIDTISQVFDIRPAGDVDIIQAAELVQKMREDWPVFQAFPGLMQVFVQDYIKVQYPKKAQEYIQALIAGDPLRQALGSMLTLLQGFMQPQEIAALPPEQQAKVAQMITQAQAVLATPTGAPEQNGQ